MTETVSEKKEIVLIDLLDRILYKGVILRGDITISVANVDLIYLGLKLLLTSVDKAEEMRRHATWEPDRSHYPEPQNKLI